MNSKYGNLLMLVLIPGLILFDLGMYFVTRATCFECHNVSEFVRNSSLTSSVIMDAIRAFKAR